MATELVQTRHPQGKANKPVPRQEYDLFAGAIVDALRGHELTHTELEQAVRRRLAGRFEGNVHWLVMTVKLDLEARGVIERIRTRPQRYRLSAAR